MAHGLLPCVVCGTKGKQSTSFNGCFLSGCPIFLPFASCLRRAELTLLQQVVGWLAHWRQMMMQKGGVKILRPRQLYVGEGKRDYVEINDRQAAPTTIGGEPTAVSQATASIHAILLTAVAGSACFQPACLPRQLQGQKHASKQALRCLLALLSYQEV